MTEENGQSTALAPVALGDDQLLAVARNAEQRVEAIKKIKAMALRVTNARDWTNQGGNPYLQVSGAEKVARLFGISWRLDEPSREDHDDGHFSYTFKGYFSMGTVEIEAIGTRSSQDPFFAGSKDRPKPPSEIDRNDVKKGAMTNCLGNGISRLLGIRNMTWEELAEGGVKKEDLGKVDFKSGTADPLAVACLPNYGHTHCKGKPVNDAAVTVDDLKYYLSGCEKDLADESKKRWHGAKITLKAAIEAELKARAAPKADRPAQGQDAPPSWLELAPEWEAWCDQQEMQNPVPFTKAITAAGIEEPKALTGADRVRLWRAVTG